MRDDRPFTDWKAVEAKLAGIPDIAGSMAYVEAEVIVKHATNAAGMGIILRGIEPARAPRVLGHRAHAEGREGRLPGAPGGDPDDISEPGASDDEPSEDGAAPARVLPGILLGEELYQHILRVFVGSEVDVACPMCGVGPTGPDAQAEAVPRGRALLHAACTSSIPSWPTCRCATRRSSWAWQGR